MFKSSNSKSRNVDKHPVSYHCVSGDNTSIKWQYIVLKKLDQGKIIKKSLISFWLFNMPIICEHAHRIELLKSLKFLVAVATLQGCRKPRLSVLILLFTFIILFYYFSYYQTCMSEIKLLICMK